MSGDIEIKRYTPALSTSWNDFVAASTNGTFLHDRRFMEYHSDRFDDHSLIFESDGKIIACLPANRVRDTLQSHGGLTFGGLLIKPSTSAAQVVEIFDSLRDDLVRQGIGALHYKPVPHIFHTQPAEADIYALFNAGARQVRTDLSAAIPLHRKLSFSSGRKYGAKKAAKAGLTTAETTDFAAFWDILAEVLDQRHDARPTHSLDEITRLNAAFPKRIRLFASFEDERMLAGVVLFDFGRSVHCLYMASSGDGRDLGALDLVVQSLVNDTFADRDWFSFGISTTAEGRELNVGLSRQKEMFGARSLAIPQYKWDLG